MSLRTLLLPLSLLLLGFVWYAAFAPPQHWGTGDEFAASLVSDALLDSSPRITSEAVTDALRILEKRHGEPGRYALTQDKCDGWLLRAGSFVRMGVEFLVVEDQWSQPYAVSTNQHIVTDLEVPPTVVWSWWLCPSSSP